MKTITDFKNNLINVTFKNNIAFACINDPISYNTNTYVVTDSDIPQYAKDYIASLTIEDYDTLIFLRISSNLDEFFEDSVYLEYYDKDKNTKSYIVHKLDEDAQYVLDSVVADLEFRYNSRASLEEAKNICYTALKRATNNILNRNTIEYNGLKIDANQESANNILNLINTVKDKTIEFRTADNEMKTIDSSDLQIMYNQVVDSINAIFKNKWSIYSKIKEAKTVEELDRIDVTQRSDVVCQEF